jgi:ABC-2 type transport system ATP-binding protein
MSDPFPQTVLTEVSTPAANAPLRFDRVTKFFDDHRALDAATLSIPTGSVTGLLGANGAGKSTLIKSAVGLIRPNSGRVTTLGQDAWDLGAHAKARLGYVPQAIELHGWMRVRHLLDFTAAFYPRWNDGLARLLLADWDVPGDRKVKTLSPGTLQKLAIVLALAHEPELLILDEPASALDPAARRQFLSTLLDLSSDAAASDRPRTTLFSTHITSDLERVADRVALMRDGRVVFDDLLDALKDDVKRLHVISDRPLAPDFDLPGRLRRRVAGREALVSVRAASPGLLESIRRDHSASVRVEDLSLEDIFLEMQHA